MFLPLSNSLGVHRAKQVGDYVKVMWTIVLLHKVMVTNTTVTCHGMVPVEHSELWFDLLL
jgi:hypothetical protein